MTPFWKARRVLVTGAGGFIGSHLVEALVEAGAEVRALVRPGGRRQGLAALGGKIKVLEADLTQPGSCAGAASGSEVVFQLAAKVAGIAYNREHPATMFRENMALFLNVIEGCRQGGAKRLVTVSSACVYPRDAKVPTPEEEGTRGEPEPTNGGYGWSKRMQETLTAAYAKEHGLDAVVVRPFNCYGPRDDFDPASSHVIPALIRRALARENPFRVWGDGKQTRSFLYVKDLVRGLLLAAEKGSGPEPVNLGADEEVTIAELVDLVLKAAEVSPKVVFDTSAPVGQPRRACDTTRAKAAFGFEARTSLRAGLGDTVDWYRRTLLAPAGR